MRTAIVALLLAGAVAARAGAVEPFLDVANNRGGIGNLKALEVGDIVTIVIVENASASTQSKLDTSTSQDVSGGPGLGMLNLFRDWGMSSSSSFAGDGKSQRTGSLSAQISAKVTEILPNGNYAVLGQRVVEINGEQQHLELSGVIRPADLGSDNVIESTYVADARIVYDGHGEIAEASSPGLLSRLANILF